MNKFIPVFVILAIGTIFILTHDNRTALAPGETVTPTKVADSVGTIFSKSRITKKPFGIYVNPKNSPVEPERFTGYHTAVDFETTEAEQNIDIPVPVLFDGKLVLKKSTSGYGGVVVVESAIEGQQVTIVYGHLKLSSVSIPVGQYVKKGETLGILGKGYSPETDGERKHLHLGIHIGPSINLLGYVQKQSDLSGWKDPSIFVK